MGDLREAGPCGQQSAKGIQSGCGSFKRERWRAANEENPIREGGAGKAGMDR